VIRLASTDMLSTRVWIWFFVLVGAGLTLPHLYDAIWQDEAYTLLQFAAHGFFYPFTDYHLPNNHPLLSSLLSALWSPGDSVVALRWPFLAAFVASSLILAWITKRLAGDIAASLAVIFFSFGTVTENFALQLRGYGISWLFVTLMMASLLSYCHSGKRIVAIIYGFSGAILLAIVPTNIITCLVIMTWGTVLLLHQRIEYFDKALRLCAVYILPMFGLLAYIMIWSQVMTASGRSFSDWSKIGALSEFYLSYLAEFIVFIPFVLLGAIVFVRQRTENTKSLGWLAAGLILVPFIFVAVMKNAPFPRNFLPLIPLISLVLAVFAEKGLMVACIKERTVLFFVVVMTILVVGLRFSGWGCQKVATLDSVSNLCHPYYQHDYRPESVATFLANRPEGASSLVLTDFEGLYALMFLNVNYNLGLNLAHYKGVNLSQSPSALPWIVLGGRIDRALTAKIVDRQIDYRLQFDSGYFKVYAPSTGTELR
jgi:hypothetical protein